MASISSVARLAARVLFCVVSFCRFRGTPAGGLECLEVMDYYIRARLCCQANSYSSSYPMPPRPARKALNAYHHGDLRDALVQAALREAERGGPEAINISALAKKLGVSQPAPYKHFADRETLLEAVTAEAFRHFTATLREAVAKPSKRSKLSRFAQATLEFGL